VDLVVDCRNDVQTKKQTVNPFNKGLI